MDDAQGLLCSTATPVSELMVPASLPAPAFCLPDKQDLSPGSQRATGPDAATSSSSCAPHAGETNWLGLWYAEGGSETMEQVHTPIAEAGRGLKAPGFCAPGLGAQLEAGFWAPVLVVEKELLTEEKYILAAATGVCPRMPAQGFCAQIGAGLTGFDAQGSQALTAGPAGQLKIGFWAKDAVGISDPKEAGFCDQGSPENQGIMET